jgi:uridylate kinase
MSQYKRVLLKLSGESLQGHQGYGIDPEKLTAYATEIKEVVDATGTQIAIVIGGGNIFRGLTGLGQGVDRVKGDQMGMLATVINSLGLSAALATAGVDTTVFTAIQMAPIGRFYNKWDAISALEEGQVVICSGGTGNPYFTTDTGASLRAVELECDVMLKGTRVDGIYTADPEKDPSATRYDTITYDEIYTKGLKVMDLTATAMCRENGMPIVVFNMDKPGNLMKLLSGETTGTLVRE